MDDNTTKDQAISRIVFVTVLLILLQLRCGGG